MESRSLVDDMGDSVNAPLVSVTLFDGRAEIVAVLSLCEVWKRTPLPCEGSESVSLLPLGESKEGEGDGDVEPRPLLEDGASDERLDVAL